MLIFPNVDPDLFGRHQRQVDNEPGSASLGTSDADSTTVGNHNLMHDGQPQILPRVSLRLSVMYLPDKNGQRYVESRRPVSLFLYRSLKPVSHLCHGSPK